MIEEAFDYIDNMGSIVCINWLLLSRFLLLKDVSGTYYPSPPSTSCFQEQQHITKV